MIGRLTSVSERYLDSEGRRRLNPVKCDFSKIYQDKSRADCIPDFVLGKNRLKPKFDIVFADFGYNTDQLNSVDGLSYMRTIGLP